VSVLVNLKTNGFCGRRRVGGGGWAEEGGSDEK